MATPRVWIGCLAAYNAGSLHGEWVDVEGLDADDLNEAIQRVLAASPETGAEEWFFPDHEDLPGIGEYSSVEDVIASAELVDKYPSVLVSGLLDHGIKLDELGDYLRDRGYGHYKNRAAYAAEHHDAMGTETGPLEAYIDWDAVGRDMLIDGCIEIEAADGIYVVSY